MIICICNNVSDRKIQQAVAAGMRTMSQLRDHLEVGTCCGKCHSCAKRVLRECLVDATPTLPVHAMTFQQNAAAA